MPPSRALSSDAIVVASESVVLLPIARCLRSCLSWMRGWRPAGQVHAKRFSVNKSWGVRAECNCNGASNLRETGPEARCGELWGDMRRVSGTEIADRGRGERWGRQQLSIGRRQVNAAMRWRPLISPATSASLPPLPITGCWPAPTGYPSAAAWLAYPA